MTKERSDNQRLEDLSRAKAKAILSQFVVNDLENDFGLDLEVALTESGEERQTVQPQNFYIQLKSSHDYGNKDTVAEDVKTDDLEYWIEQPVPVVLVAYSEAADELYWTVIQSHVWDVLNKENPSWRRQGQSRVKISRDQRLGDLEDLENAIHRTQNRIIRRQSRGLNIGEGVEFTPEDFSDMDAQIESDLLGFKGHTLEKAYQLFNQGRTEEGEELVKEVYEAPRDDKGKLKSINAQVFHKDSFEPEVALEVMDLAEEGIELAGELDEPGDEQYLIVHNFLSRLYVLLDKQKQFIIQQKIQEEADYDLNGFEHLFLQQFRELAEEQLISISAINIALSTLLEESLYYEYAVCLSPVLDYISRQLMQLVALGVVDRDAIREDDEHPFVDQCEQLLDFLSEDEVAFNLNKSLGLYYYYSFEPQKSEERLERAIEIAETLDNDSLVERSKELLEDVREHPDPYARYEESVERPEDVERSTEQYQESMEEVVEFLGYDLSNTDDRQVEVLQIGIDDADPSEYFRHCEHLRISYWSSSMLGKMTGVTTIGQKVMWCKHGGTTIGASLEVLFRGFKQDHCEGCEHHCQRDDDWECTVGWVQEQEDDPEFQKVLDDIEENLPY